MVVASIGVVAIPAQVQASPCGGSTTTFTATSFSDSSGDDAAPCEGPCAEYRAWRAKNAPVISLEVGVATRTLASTLGEQTGTVTHDSQSFSYRVVGPAAQPEADLEHAVVGQLRVTVPQVHGFYIAGELELGALTSSNVAARMTSSGELGTPTLTPSSTGLVGGNAVLGFGGRLAGVDLGVEIAGGGRVLAYTYDSTYLACETTSTITAGSAVLEGRARASVWLTPHLTLSALAGKSALDSGMMGGLTLGFTNHAFGVR